MLVHLASSKTQSNLSTFTEDQIQPNAVDLRLDRVFELDGQSAFILTEDDKTHRNKREILPDLSGMFRFNANTSYEILFEGIITMGANEAGWVITRSTLNRNGLFITSGLYDSGYGSNGQTGVMAACLHNNSGMAFIKKGTRIGQFILIQAEALHSYDGSYGKITGHDSMYFQ